MPSVVVGQLLDRLRNVSRSGEGWTTLCPAHEDTHSSLSVGEGEDGRVLVKCFAGCTTEEIVAALGLKVGDLFPDPDPPRERRVAAGPVVVEDLARDKSLPAEFLESLGLADRHDGVVVPYRLQNGKDASRNRLRTALRAKEGSLWLFGKGSPVPYGLDRLHGARELGYLVLVEGESDCWTGWHHGVPTLGIPGAAMTSKLEADHVQGIAKVFVVKEPDAGGDVFVNGVANRLGALQWSGELFVVGLGDAQDLNELHKRDPGDFKTALQQALDDARPLPVVTPTQESSSTARIEALLAQSRLAKLEADATSDAIEVALRELVDCVAGCDPLRQTLIRNAAIGHLKKIGVGSPARLVDAALNGVYREGRHDDSGNARIILREVEPSSEPVDGIALLNDIVETITRHVALDKAAADACALWVAHAYAISASYVSPILAVISPAKRCGKTTLLSLLTALVAKPLPASNITPAVVFRTIESYMPTLLVDEADTFIKKNDELRGVLNAGHTRATAQVLRTVGDKHEPQAFSTWCPKAIALIGRLPGTLEDRSVVISMRRRTSGESVVRLRMERVNVDLGPLRSRCARWTLDNEETLRQSDPDIPAQLHDRAQDNWRPLIAIADLVRGEWPQRARQAAVALTGVIEEGAQAAGVQLLEDLRVLFRAEGAAQLASKMIVEDLGKMEDRPWPEWRMGKPLTQTQLAKLLKPFDVRPKTIRTAEGTAKGYLARDLADAFTRYLPPESSHRNNADVSTDSVESVPSQDRVRDGSRNSEKAQDVGLVTAVTDWDRGSADHETNGPDSQVSDDTDRETFEI